MLASETFFWAKTKQVVETATIATTAIPSITYLALFMTQLCFLSPNLSKRIDRMYFRTGLGVGLPMP